MKFSQGEATDGQKIKIPQTIYRGDMTFPEPEILFLMHIRDVQIRLECLDVNPFFSEPKKFPLCSQHNY
jgi:hypothetical protein